MNEPKSKGSYRRRKEAATTADDDRRRCRNEHLGHITGLVDKGMRAFFADRQIDRPSVSSHLIFQCHTGGVRNFVSRLKQARDKHALASLPTIASQSLQDRQGDVVTSVAVVSDSATGEAVEGQTEHVQETIESRATGEQLTIQREGVISH